MTSRTAQQHSGSGQEGSRINLGARATAAVIGKPYDQHFAASTNPDKRPGRSDDGEVSSATYASAGKLPGDALGPAVLRVDYRHPLERWLGLHPVRWLLGEMASCNGNGITPLERIIASYRNPAASRSDRLLHWPVHLLIDWLRGNTDVATFRKRIAEHRPTVRGLVIVLKSLAEFGPIVPQRFVSPLFAVWNFTNRCNLACKHCYQDSGKAALDDELSLQEKLDLVDQMGSAHLPMLALSGGEPTMSPDLLPVLRRAQQYGMHATIATNGTTMTAELAGRLAEAGLRYVEISLDSVDPARHDAFRGVAGMWQRAVAGAGVVAATAGLRLGIAMCVHQGNFHEVRDMISFAESLGAGCFAHFNFIPVGRGLKMVHGDISPSQREELLGILNEKMQTGGIGVISTAPQLGRVCLAGSTEGRAACSHAGSGSGVKARVVAKYLGGCGAGRTYVCIEPNGDVTPCVYLPHRVMGNVRRAPLVEVFRRNAFWDVLNDRANRLGHCEVCAFRNYCGGCRARADAYHGQLHGGDPGCIFNSKHWDALVASGVAVAEDAQTPAGDMKLTPIRHGPA